ncbi:hypothetical protein EMPS_05307 [Entomortierella parvispora]|uniref:F-box domain-containing protein n=1 Tax=Entomortierella parvispora TaxID=205924 RepID=A0A9P3HA69_9FUNG|nr:hypothetical protein EMPS_05307 [Entomortierella parvispora]
MDRYIPDPGSERHLHARLQSVEDRVRASDMALVRIQYQAQIHLPKPSLKLMKKNAHHVRHLVFRMYGNAPPAAQLVRYPYLQTVRFECTDSFDRNAYGYGYGRATGGFKGSWDFIAGMIENQPYLHKIIVNANNQMMEMPETFVSALSTCLKLDDLQTSGLSFIMQYFQTVLPRVRRLTSSGGRYDLPPTWKDDGTSFPNLQYLVLNNSERTSKSTELGWLLQCPNLTALVWSRSELPLKLFCELVPAACPQLTSLELRSQLSDQDVALILTSFPKIEQFSVYSSKFGPQSPEALRRHLPTLKEINFRENRAPTSKTVQEILSSFPDLLRLGSDDLFYEEHYRQPWVCHNLRSLDIGIGMESWNRHNSSHFKQRQVYKRLSELTQLESLTIGPVPNRMPLEFTMSAGIDELKTLTKLKHFHWKGDFHKLILRSEVVDWMLQNWKRITTLEGFVSPGDPSFKKIKETLEERGIIHIGTWTATRHSEERLFGVYDPEYGGLPDFGGSYGADDIDDGMGGMSYNDYMDYYSL